MGSVLAGLFLALLEAGGPMTASGGGPATKPGSPLLIFAAASLSDVLPRVAEAWSRAGKPKPTFTFDASSRLARQILDGAPADLFVSADTAWTGELIRRGEARPGSEVVLLENDLVVIVQAGAGWAPGSLADLADPRVGHLALAGEAVPAGRYARAALRAAGVWSGVEARVVNGDNVRAAMTWVSTGEAEAGIVYATDVRVEPRVRVAFPVDRALHPPIVYPALVVGGARHAAAAGDFLEFCRGPEARGLFERAGFRLPGPAGRP